MQKIGSLSTTFRNPLKTDQIQDLLRVGEFYEKSIWSDYIFFRRGAEKDVPITFIGSSRTVKADLPEFTNTRSRRPLHSESKKELSRNPVSRGEEHSSSLPKSSPESSVSVMSSNASLWSACTEEVNKIGVCAKRESRSRICRVLIFQFMFSFQIFVFIRWRVSQVTWNRYCQTTTNSLPQSLEFWIVETLGVSTRAMLV